jgi:HAD superfamily hydrolase (TIGR01509 family)
VSERRSAGVIFDLDGVIVDSEPLQYRAYAAVLEALGVSITRAEYAREWIAAGHGPEYAVRTYRLSLTPADLKARKSEVYGRLLQTEARLIPGARAALDRLGAAFRLGLATNSSRTDTRIALDAFDLGSRFEAIVTRELYTEAKPAPDAYVAAARLLGLDPQRCVVVEDSERGVAAARGAGCACVVVPNEMTAGHDFSAAERVVSSLDEVTAELVQGLLGS